MLKRPPKAFPVQSIVVWLRRFTGQVLIPEVTAHSWSGAMLGSVYFQCMIQNRLAPTFQVTLPMAILKCFTDMNKVNLNTVSPFCSPICDLRQLSTHVLNPMGERERLDVLLQDISSDMEQVADLQIRDLKSYFKPSTQTSAPHLSQHFQPRLPSLAICCHYCTTACSHFLWGWSRVSEQIPPLPRKVALISKCHNEPALKWINVVLIWSVQTPYCVIFH